MGRSWAIVLGALVACGPRITRSSTPSGPAWAALGDRTDGAGSIFVCQGHGQSEEAALAAAQSVCTDKLCRVCGVERCRQVGKAPLRVEHKSVDCGPGGCAVWLEVSSSKQDEESECAGYAPEHFADPAQCERWIAEFRNAAGRTAVSLRRRAQLLDQALEACNGIDVRPTPLLEALRAQLLAGLDGLELTTPGSLRQQLEESKTLLARIQLVRDYVHDRALVLEVIEATLADDLDTIDGVARLQHALEAAPLGAQYESADVHFASLDRLGELRADITQINRFYRRSYRPQSLFWQQGIPLAHMFAKDGQVDDADWNYIFDLHREHSCVMCLSTLLDVKNHTRPELRDERFFAALQLQLKQDRTPEERRRTLAQLLPHDSEFVLHVRPLLPPDLR